MATATLRLVDLKCYCGLPVYPTEDHYKAHTTHGTKIYCPLGHTPSWGDTEIEQLRNAKTRLTAEVDRQRARAEHTERQLSAAKGQQTRLKKRIGNGVCPCCNRHFTNVERHMKTQHPDFTEPEKG